MNHLLEINQRTKLYASTPEVGKGNPTETKALAHELSMAGFEVIEEYPSGFWVHVGAEFHIRMSQSTDETIGYAETSLAQRSSVKTKPLIAELRRTIARALRKYPDAHFLITPQSMLGELATKVTYQGKKFNVIMVLPDAMGKLSIKSRPTHAQKEIEYLVWNRNSYEVMQTDLGLEYVQLIEPVDPLQAYKSLTKTELEKAGFEAIFEQEKLCVIKLSGSGGDPKLINAVITSLWNNSGIRSIVFPGQERTRKKIISRINRNMPQIKQSLNEGEFYNVANELIPNQQLLLTYPSEQFKHVMVLSKKGKQIKVAWLPPRGDHELTNLINYVLIASKQGITTTICIPYNHHDYLGKKLKNAGFIQGRDFELVEPEKITKQHFHQVPSWNVDEARFSNSLPRIHVAKAISNIVAKHL